MNTNIRIINTGLYSAIATNALDHGCLGQLSDGWGENTPSNDKYWRFMSLKRAEDNEILLKVDDSYGSGFVHKSDFEVREWLANILKKTVKMNINDSNIGSWSRENTTKSLYAGDIRVNEAYLIYEILKGRSRAKSRYPQSVVDEVVGKPLTTKEIELKNAISCVNQNLANAIEALKHEYDMKISELKKNAELEVQKLMAA